MIIDVPSIPTIVIAAQMYGRYTKDLGEYAKDESRKLKILERRRKQEDKIRNKVRYNCTREDNAINNNNNISIRKKGTVRPSGQSCGESDLMGVAENVRSHGRGLGVSGVARPNHGYSVVCHGQGHCDVHEW